MIDSKEILKARKQPFKIILLLLLAYAVFTMLPSQGAFAQDGYDIYFDSVEQWLIMAYTEYNPSTGKYEVYLKVADSEGTLVSQEDIKGLEANPHLIAENAENPMVCLAFDSESGTAYVEYETEAGLVTASQTFRYPAADIRLVRGGEDIRRHCHSGGNYEFNRLKK
jgi:hypothetical protein